LTLDPTERRGHRRTTFEDSGTALACAGNAPPGTNRVNEDNAGRVPDFDGETLSMAGADSAARALYESDDEAPKGVLSLEGPSTRQQSYDDIDWDSFLPDRATTLRWRVAQVVKRGADIVLSFVGLIVLSPLLLLLAAAVRLTSKGPVLYEWRVLGKHAQPFLGYKFRTMVENADELKEAILAANEMTGPVFKMRNDPRITPIGRWMRKYSLDELPQLWSVLKGDMSLVGPRPPFAYEFAHYDPWQRGKLAVTPGITCIWQVNGRSEISDFEQWMELDRTYIQEWSLWLDLKLLARTVPVVLSGHGAY
jgi:lipopolysaccharide/colanic/teichoic acid biosynthesis glycosyltransferase